MTLKLETIVATAARNAPEPLKKKPASPVKQTQLKAIRRVKIAVDKKMSYLLSGFAVNLINSLFDEMEKSDKTRSKYFNIMRALKTEYAPCIEEYTVLTNLSWVNLIKKKDKSALPEPSSDIARLLARYSKKTTVQHIATLEELRLRFSSLVQTELHYHPLLPANFYLCFWHATERLGLKTEERKLLLPAYHRLVMNRIDEILTVASQSLVDQSISYGKCQRRYVRNRPANEARAIRTGWAGRW
jgi:hypothetical protein